MNLTIVISNKRVDRLLGKAIAELQSKGDMAKACLNALGEYALNEERRLFIEHSRPGSSFWPRLSVPTVILRPGGPKIRSEADLEAKRASATKLRDRGTLLDSLSRSGPHNVFRVGTTEVVVGTRDRRAALLHSGGFSEPFRMTPKMWRLFKANVSPLVAGRRAPRRSARATMNYFEDLYGYERTRRRAWAGTKKGSPWNRLYFIWRNTFRKWDREGRRGRVPARPIIVPATKEMTGRFREIVAYFVRQATGGGGATE